MLGHSKELAKSEDINSDNDIRCWEPAAHKDRLLVRGELGHLMNNLPSPPEPIF